MLLPGQHIGTTTRFYVRAGGGAWLESDYVRTIEEARKEMDREYWKGRKPVIVKRETVETIVEEGK
jgi:hypothetical protein